MAMHLAHGQMDPAIADQLRLILRDTLHIGTRADRLSEASGLFGMMPEFDSMAVVAVVAALEERFGIVIEDEDISAEVFATVGSLAAFVERKVAA